MDKVLVNLYVPAAEEHFDLFVPLDLDIATLTQILSQGVNELCGGRYTISGSEMLQRLDPDVLFHPSKFLSDYGVADGTKLVLL